MSIQKLIPMADPAIVPVEGPANAPREMTERAGILAAEANPFGANNEQLPEKLQEALRRLVFSILDGIGIHAAAGGATDQAGAPILARAAIFVVERAGPELASSV